MIRLRRRPVTPCPACVIRRALADALALSDDALDAAEDAYVFGGAPAAVLNALFPARRALVTAQREIDDLVRAASAGAGSRSDCHSPPKHSPPEPTCP